MAKDKSAAPSEQMERLIAQIAERVRARLIDIQEPMAVEASEQSDTRCVWELCGKAETLRSSLAGDAALNAACRLVSEASDASQGMVVAELSPTDMCRIVDGIGGSAFANRVINALLAGKPVIVLKEGVGFMTYQASAPINFYRHFEEAYHRLMQNGVTVCAKKDLPSVLLGREQPTFESDVMQSFRGKRVSPEPKEEAEPPADESAKAAAEGEIAMARHIITEQAVIPLTERQDIRAVIINQDAIVTDMAEELLEDHHIAIVKRG
ncbi:hypothetical protein [Pseudoramibacter faecis]|uniref:hypothetical protein n=1 Tax=Pseudoramibacter faecis TaxID=3108534 RepID=UPI002E772FE7|nr:hypothetical protein [Pseudoramibacter sp. HA2172]